jgi:Transport protein particle (TRAPP) component
LELLAARMDLQHSILAVKSDRYNRTRVDKVNAELVTLTYGTIVAQLCRDYEGDYVEVNKQLDKMGYNIGLRLIEDYLAKSNTMRRCSNFRETAEMISKARSRLLSFRYLTF